MIAGEVPLYPSDSLNRDRSGFLHSSCDGIDDHPGYRPWLTAATVPGTSRGLLISAITLNYLSF